MAAKFAFMFPTTPNGEYNPDNWVYNDEFLKEEGFPLHCVYCDGNVRVVEVGEDTETGEEVKLSYCKVHCKLVEPMFRKG